MPAGSWAVSSAQCSEEWWLFKICNLYIWLVFIFGTCLSQKEKQKTSLWGNWIISIKGKSTVINYIYFLPLSKFSISYLIKSFKIFFFKTYSTLDKWVLKMHLQQNLILIKFSIQSLHTSFFMGFIGETWKTSSDGPGLAQLAYHEWFWFPGAILQHLDWQKGNS